MLSLILQIIVGTLAIFLATKFVAGVSLTLLPESSFLGIHLTETWQIFLVVGGILGITNFFIRPLLRMIFFPLRLITFGLFSLVIDMVLIWIIDIIFPELIISGIIPLFWTTIIVLILSLLATNYDSGKKPYEQ